MSSTHLTTLMSNFNISAVPFLSSLSCSLNVLFQSLLFISWIQYLLFEAVIISGLYVDSVNMTGCSFQDGIGLFGVIVLPNGQLVAVTGEAVSGALHWFRQWCSGHSAVAVARSALVSRSNFCICKLTPDHKADVFSILVRSPFCNNFASVYPIFLPMPLSPTPHQWLVYREEGQCDRN